LGASSRRRFTDYGNTVQPDVPDAGHDPDHGPNTATYVQMGNQLDTLEPGKLADIVLLDGNPLEGYWNWLKTTVVIKGGVVVVDQRPKPRSTGRPASGGVASRPLPAQHDEIALRRDRAVAVRFDEGSHRAEHRRDDGGTRGAALKPKAQIISECFFRGHCVVAVFSIFPFFFSKQGAYI
jgi:hypothetical protein